MHLGRLHSDVIIEYTEKSVSHSDGKHLSIYNTYMYHKHDFKLLYNEEGSFIPLV